MILQSFSYILFLALTALLVFVTPARFRHWVLLVASFYFYISFDLVWSLLLLFTIIFVFILGILISNEKRKSLKRIYFWGGILVLISNLLLVKYLGYSLLYTKASFPLGISFFTFLVIGYLADIFLEQVEAEKNPIYFALFVSFFPTLTAGPIERSKHLLPQLRKIADFQYDRIRASVLLIALGFFKKIVIADSLNDWVAAVYSNPKNYSGWTLYFATVLARYQIFADFSAYTDIALGSAGVFGIELIQNFNQPFAATSIADHWRRWHISLSNWMRDYLFYPLITSPFSRLGINFNIFFVFLFLGLWHGGTINFILLGVSQGLMMVLHNLSGEFREKVARAMRLDKVPRLRHALEVTWTFCIIVALPTVFFKAKTFQDSLIIFKGMFSGIFSRLPNASDLSFLEITRVGVWPFIIMLIIVHEILLTINSRYSISLWLKEKSALIRWSIYLLMIFIFMVLGHFEKTVDFAYRNF